MKYDFETVMERNEDCLAAEKIPFEGVQPEEGVSRINMWIADMSFPTAPSILKAIRERTDKAHFGYFSLSDRYYDSIISWQERRNGVSGLEKDDIGYENGVLGGLSSAVQVLTCPGENILLHAPTYIGFTHTLDAIGRNIVLSRLKMDENGIWRMDYEDMDRKIKENDIRVCIFCSPHNPTGRVWERQEIEKAMQVYRDNGCTVISDEIWSDIIMPGFKHIPTQSVSEDARNRTVALYAPSKTFSLAGLIGAYHIIYNKELRARIRRFEEMSRYNSQNVLSMHALTGAFSDEGEQWAEEMIGAVDKNLSFACSFIDGNLPGVKVSKPQGTYMLYLDCSEFCASKGISIKELQHRGVRKGVIWQDGEAFNWPDTIRMNFALPYSLAEEAMKRLKESVFV